jgi:hypothetical protein
MPDNDQKLAFMHGPILLAGIVGENVPIPGQYATEQYDFFELPSVDVPALNPQTGNIDEWMESKGNLEFELTGVGEASGITLAPYYKVNHDYYTIYWDVENGNN